MTYGVIMAILFGIVFHTSQGRPGDCDLNQYGSNCAFYCGYKTTFSYCNNDLCCCGYNNANSWLAFRWNEGEGGCRDDPNPRIPANQIVCNIDQCQQACKDTPGYKIDPTMCSCGNYYVFEGTQEIGWKWKYDC